MRGFTLIEILIVIGISAILVSLSGSVYISLSQRSDVDREAQELESVLSLARSKTLASHNEQSFGVHINSATNEYFLFEGASYNPIAPGNKRFDIASGVSISSLNLNGGGSDIVFDRLTGESSDFGSVILQDLSDTSRLRAICIDASGIAEVQSACAVTSFEYTNGTTDGNLASFPANSGFGDPAQSFTVGSGDIYVKGADLYLRRTTASPSDVFWDVRQISTVGTALGRSWIVRGTSLPSSFGWISFTFPRPVFLLANTQYFLRLRSLPDSTIAFSYATGTIYWGYAHSASAPPAYAGGDAWRYVGQNNVLSYAGERLGPSDQYDFSFRINYGIDPPSVTDSRHMEFDLGWSIRGHTTLKLVFHDPPNPDVVKDVAMSGFFNGTNTEFDWEGTVVVGGSNQTMRIHTYYLDSEDTMLSIDRDRRVNNKAVDVSIDGMAIASYAINGTPTVGANGGSMIYR